MAERGMSMVDRVARALCPEYFDGRMVVTNKAELQMFALHKARLAIEAMREPTTLMIKHANDLQSSEARCFFEPRPECYWADMIDAALSETSAKEP